VNYRESTRTHRVPSSRSHTRAQPTNTVRRRISTPPDRLVFIVGRAEPFPVRRGDRIRGDHTRAVVLCKQTRKRRTLAAVDSAVGNCPFRRLSKEIRSDRARRTLCRGALRVQLSFSYGRACGGNRFGTNARTRKNIHFPYGPDQVEVCPIETEGKKNRGKV